MTVVWCSLASCYTFHAECAWWVWSMSEDWLYVWVIRTTACAANLVIDRTICFILQGEVEVCT